MKLSPVKGLPEFEEGMDPAVPISECIRSLDYTIETIPILCVAHKIISKAEGMYRSLDDIDPSERAKTIAEKSTKSPELIQLILDYASDIVHVEKGTVIAETKHGFVCANAGIDTSNVNGKQQALLMPDKPDQSASKLSDALTEKLDREVAVLITDTWGRPWREGQVNFAIGVSGISPIRDYRGEKDAAGQLLKTSKSAVADELASAAEPLMGKSREVPAVLITGHSLESGEGTASELVRSPGNDFFR